MTMADKCTGLPYRVVPLGVFDDWRPIPRTLRLPSLYRTHVRLVEAFVGRKSVV
jgi:hypothetical protein